jgi:beta-lactam-binding protein with PASTA domain
MDTTVADPLVGQLLDGRYRVESRIARGGMATVYVARDIKLGREIALKVMHANLAQDEGFVRRFIGEAKSAAALSHPNVVAVYDQGSDGHHVFLAMEYVPGRTLRDLLNERGRLGPRQALDIMQKVLAALGAAHRAGLVHRDVKPENVLLTGEGDELLIKVADFGLARAETDSKQTKTGLIIGTVAYMAPEQVLSGDSDARSDVYAAGILLFELLTGRQPHQAESPLSVAYKHVNEVVPLPSSVLPGLPPQLDALVAAATNRDPGHRPPDAERFLGAMMEAARSLPPDIDRRMAGVVPGRPNNVTSVMQAPAFPSTEAGRPTFIAPGMLRQAQHGAADDRPLADRLLAMFTGRFVLIGIGLIALIVLGWAVWYQTAGQYSTVPKTIIGMPVADAKAQLQGKGYKVTTGAQRTSQTIPKGSVAATDPVPGSRVSGGALITLYPSSGKKPIELPNLKGQSQADAQKKLTDLGFASTITQEPSDNYDQGKVTRTNPAGGQMAQPGSDQITIYVSSGIQVPNVVGQQTQNAKQLLESKGFVVNVQEQDAQDGQQKGVVLSQNPPADSPANKGDTITLIATKQDQNCAIPVVNWFCQNNGNGQQVQVPNVTGMSVKDARKTLHQAGFNVNVTGFTGDTVRFQNPSAGATAQQGSTVTILRSP